MPRERAGRDMSDLIFALDRDAAMSLQHQLRRKLMDAIYRGVLKPGCRLPSSRGFAQRLHVSRNTVALAYAALVADGHLVGRDRSGIFVADDVRVAPVVGRRNAPKVASPLSAMLPESPRADAFRCPHNWRQYPWPFLDGCIDPALTPVREWREAIRFASSPRDAGDWTSGNGELDDPMLTEELRSKILPERGIDALPGEVLVLSSARQALQMLARLLVHAGTPVCLEEPVDYEFLRTVIERRARVDRFDPAHPDRLPPKALVVTSARKGIVSASPMPESLLSTIKRCGGIVIEQDTPPDVDEPTGFAPALHAVETGGRLVYVGSLSPVVAGGTPPAVVVAPSPVIEHLRRLRKAAGAEPGLLQQRAWAYFIALGHYAAGLHRARRLLGERRAAMRDALNHYLHDAVSISTVAGASTHWVRCHDERDTDVLARQAASLGVLLRPGRLAHARHAFAMGVTGVDADRIRDGVRTLARLFHDASRPVAGTPGEAHAPPLAGAALRRAVAGKTLIYNTVYGEPCTIAIQRNGELRGIAGHANDDCDEGRWWVEKDRWFRQWQSWAYGEVSGFRVVIDGREIRWYDDHGKCVDRAVIVPAARRRARRTGPTKSR